ncbi:interferon-related developmental regulator 2-like [Bradysia coprophila]|uniref:interferon-related developmental regulator 2-like n=1 Tax=Bradysia coprophila TaxID=38358 RepID=UPI00187D9178|nr:interferon-related developmental regulator 2-like [Bradysia coprophila]
MFLEPKMNLFRQIFSGTQSKHHKTLKENSTHKLLTNLRTKALEGWGLLLTLCSLEDVCILVRDKIIDELTELMINDSNAEIRIACGQLISLIIELGRLRQSKYFKQNMSDTCVAITDIINDRNSGKHKLQNSSLREVLKYVEDGWNPSFIVRFDNEVHELKTWSSIFKYQKFCQFIGPNAAARFSENERVRAIVPIGLKSVLSFWCLQPSTQYILSCAATRKSKTKQTRLDREVPKFGYL